MEPFVLEGPATAERIDDFRAGVAEKAAVAKKIAKRFHLPDIVVGATVVSIGTTLPEVMVSTAGALQGNFR